MYELFIQKEDVNDSHRPEESVLDEEEEESAEFKNQVEGQ